MTTAKKGLGKGLSALIDTEVARDNNGIIEIDINKIEPNKQQPRKYFDEEALQELAASITSYGIIQPLILKEENGYFSIIAGERRWRAARIANKATVPAIIKDYSETEALQIALIENLQRKDLNPIEEASCYKRLIDEFFFSQDDVAAKVGKSRNAISYAVGLLNLDSRVQDFIVDGRLSPGHGRVLLGVKDLDTQFSMSERIIEDDLSIRITQKLVKAHHELLQQRQEEDTTAAVKQPVVTSFVNVENLLKDILGTKVNIRDGKKKGLIEIEYYSHDELDRLLLLLKKISGPQ